MKKTLLVLSIVALTGCSATAPKVVHNPEQYCHTSSTKTLKDGSTSSSEVVVECSDKPDLNNMKIVKAGIADTCREYYYYMNGVYKRGYICRKLDKNGGHGGWEIVNRMHFN